MHLLAVGKMMNLFAATGHVNYTNERQIVPADDTRAPNGAPMVIPKAGARISCSMEQ